MGKGKDKKAERLKNERTKMVFGSEAFMFLSPYVILIFKFLSF